MIEELLHGADRDSQLHFWEVLAHNLTIAVRAVWSDALLDNADKVDQIKFINELQHHVTAKVYTFRLDEYEWPPAEFDREIEVLAGRCPAIRSHLLSAVTFTARSVLGQEPPVGT